MNQSLKAKITNEEVKQAVFSMSDHKSPGPNGFNVCFFKKSWTNTGALICEAVKEFQRTGKLLTQINATSVCLLPKKLNASMISDFRPISCCNVVYKIVTKVLANKL